MATIKIEIGKKNKSGQIPVSLLVRSGKTRKRIPTGMMLDESDVTSSGKIKNKEKALIIDNLHQKYQNRLYLLSGEMDAQKMDASVVADLITSVREKSQIDFFEFADDWIRNSGVKGIKNYNTMLNKLKAYNRGTKLSFKSINYDFLVGFERYLSDKPRAQSLYLGLLRHLYREAMRRYNNNAEPIITNDPFISYRPPKQKINKGVRSISQEELLKVYNYKGIPHGRAQLARDCFILSFCLMGINSVDLYECSTRKGWTLCYNRAKTKERRNDNAYIEVEIHPFIQKLAKKYLSGDKKHVFNFHQRYCSPIEFNRALNIGLKEVGENIGINNLQFYQARHTFATLSRNLMRFSKGDVDEALNHVGSFDIADIYIKKDFTIINENNKKLIEKVFCSEYP